MARDAMAAIVEYNRRFVRPERDPRWLKAKLDRLTTSPFAFLRGTFHLFMHDWPAFGDDPLAPGAPQPIVGDLHLENFGAYQSADGAFVFDVNDFDETGDGEPAIDLMRTATSFLLADEKHGELRALSRIEAFVGAYVEAVRAGDLGPLTPKSWKLPDRVGRAIDDAAELARGQWLAKRVTGEAGARRFVANEKYFPVTDEKIRAEVSRAVKKFCDESAMRPKNCGAWGSALDVAVRIAGTGSLGRFRYAVLLPGDDEKVNRELVLELKEAIPSSLAPGDAADQAARVVEHQRKLQAASPPYLGEALLHQAPFTVRALQPTDAKLDSASMRGSERDELCAACGTVLGRLHARGAVGFRERLVGRERALLRRVAAFALRYADRVDEDFELLKKSRGEVERALGI